jgi:hypothetical protein
MINLKITLRENSMKSKKSNLQVEKIMLGIDSRDIRSLKEKEKERKIRNYIEYKFIRFLPLCNGA